MLWTAVNIYINIHLVCYSVSIFFLLNYWSISILHTKANKKLIHTVAWHAKQFIWIGSFFQLWHDWRSFRNSSERVDEECLIKRIVFPVCHRKNAALRGPTSEYYVIILWHGMRNERTKISERQKSDSLNHNSGFISIKLLLSSTLCNYVRSFFLSRDSTVDIHSSQTNFFPLISNNTSNNYGKIISCKTAHMRSSWVRSTYTTRWCL